MLISILISYKTDPIKMLNNIQPGATISDLILMLRWKRLEMRATQKTNFIDAEIHNLNKLARSTIKILKEMKSCLGAEQCFNMFASLTTLDVFNTQFGFTYAHLWDT